MRRLSGKLMLEIGRRRGKGGRGKKGRRKERKGKEGKGKRKQVFKRQLHCSKIFD